MSLKTTIELIDKVSSGFDSASASGVEALSKIEESLSSANEAYSQYSDSASNAVKTTSHWTSAADMYNKSAMEAVYTTEELVDMGYKSQDALDEQNDMFKLCEDSADRLSQSIEATTEIENALAEAIAMGTEKSEEMASADSVSAETKEELTSAIQEASEAIIELESAQREAESAQREYDAVIESGTTNLEELEAAAERAGHAAENLAEANYRSSQATEELENATAKADEELENAGTSGMDAIQGIAGAIASAKIVDKVMEISEAVYDMTVEFSNAESTVVMATGATGQQLDNLSSSMLEVYRTSKNTDWNETSSAIGEINTRLHLEGEELEKSTSLFLDYANVTNQSVSPAVAGVSKLMNQWNIEASETESTLDKLVYAGEYSGISVSNLTDTLTTNRGVLEQLDFSLDNSISMLSEMELQGVNSTTVMTGFRTAISKLAEDGQDASTGIRVLFDDIKNAETDTEATSKAVEYFGTRAGVTLAAQIRSGNLSIDNMTSSLEESENALEKTANAAQTLDQKWEQASRNVNSAFMKQTNPVIEKISKMGADLWNGFGDLLNKYPVVTNIITSLGIGLGALAVGVAGVAAAEGLATLATTAFGTAITAVLPELTIAAGVIAGVVAVGGFLIDMFEESRDASDKLTVASQEQSDKIDSLQSEYDKLVESGQGTSEKALLIKADIDELTESYENNKETVGDLIIEQQHLNEKLDELEKNDDLSAIDDEAVSAQALATKLFSLAEGTDKSANSQNQMLAIINKLNAQFPELNLNYDDVIKKTGKTKEALESYLESLYNKKKYDEAQEQWTETFGLLEEQKSQFEKLSSEIDPIFDKYLSSDGNAVAYNEYQDGLNQMVTYTNEAGEEIEMTLYEAYTKSAENVGILQDKLEDYEGVMLDTAGATDEAVTTSEDAVNQAASGIEEQLTELTTKYQEAYESAYESFHGQYQLWDKADDVSTTSVETIKGNLDSQITYWTEYDKNLSNLQNRNIEGLNDVLKKLDDGSKESAGVLAGLASASDSEIQKVVKKYQDLDSKQSDTADKVAKTESDFVDTVNDLQSQMEKTVTKDMNLTSKAQESARSTIESYANQLRNSSASIDTAMDSVVSKIKSKLNITITPKVNVDTSKITPGKGYATGTDYAEPGLHWVGENGPEIVDFSGGEKVYTADESAELFGPVDTNKQYTYNDDTSGSKETNTNTEYVSSNKKITIELVGSGSIQATGSNTDEIVATMQEHIRPILIDLITEETEEEGERVLAY